VPYVSDLINSDRVDNVSVRLTGIAVGADEAFNRVERPGYRPEYRAYMFVKPYSATTKGYISAVERLGYRTDYNSDFKPQFTFAAENTRVEYEGYPDAISIWPGGKTTSQGGYGSQKSGFEYNEEDHLYYRFQSGEPQIDEMNNEQLTCSNIVFQYAEGRQLDPNDYLDFTIHADPRTPKKAVIFTNGKMIEGTWYRPLVDANGNEIKVPAKFHDLQGNEIILNQGKTWICLIWDEYADAILIE
jgi:hypothetical protein